MKIVCDNKIPFLKGVFEPYSDVLYLSGAQTTYDTVKDADALITRTRTICNESLLSSSAVRIIASATIGFDHIDTQYCDAHGIKWTNAPGCNSASVAQYIASVLCNLALKYDFCFEDKTLGIVGVGNVGSKVAKLALSLGMKVLCCDPPLGKEGYVGLDEIIAKSDIVTLHVPLDKSTYHLIDVKRLVQMRKDQILINSSRGPVVDNTALKQALQAARLKAAVLDVWEGEPIIDRELINMLDIATPHIAGYSTDGKANGTAQSVRAVATALGLPLTEWSCNELPEPKGGLIYTIDAQGLSGQELIMKAILATYDVMSDDAAFRSAPDKFESLRGDYHIRREPKAFTIKLLNATAQQKAKLIELGFTVE